MKQTTYICDHCKSKILDLDQKYIQTTIQISPTEEAVRRNYAIKVDATFDLCPSCYTILRDYISKFLGRTE